MLMSAKIPSASGKSGVIPLLVVGGDSGGVLEILINGRVGLGVKVSVSVGGIVEVLVGVSVGWGVWVIVGRAV